MTNRGVFKEKTRCLSDRILEISRSHILHRIFRFEDTVLFKIHSLTQYFDTIFASSDNAALGAIQVLKERDIKVPEECAVVGFSNNEFTSYVTPTITTVEQHSRKMGIISSQLLLDKMEENDNTTTKKLPRKTILTPELIVRESSVRKK